MKKDKFKLSPEAQEECFNLINMFGGLVELDEFQDRVNHIINTYGEYKGVLTDKEIDAWRSKGYLVFIGYGGQCVVIKKVKGE